MPNSMDVTLIRQHDMDVLVEQIASKVKAGYAKASALTNVINGTTNITYSGSVTNATTVKAALDALATLVSNAQIAANTANTNLGTTSTAASKTSTAAWGRIKQLQNDLGASSDSANASGSAFARIAATKSVADGASSSVSNVISGTTNIAYSPGSNTELSSTNVKAAIDELGVRTNSNNFESAIDDAVEVSFSSYNFTIENGDLILYTPTSSNAILTKVEDTVSSYGFSLDENDNLILTTPDN